MVYFFCALLLNCEKDGDLVDTRISNFYGHWHVQEVITSLENDSITAESLFEYNVVFREDYSGKFYQINIPAVDSLSFTWSFDLENDKFIVDAIPSLNKPRTTNTMVTNSKNRIVFNADQPNTDPTSVIYAIRTSKMDRVR